MYEFLDTLKYMHSQSLSHRDIKPDNIMYDVDNKIIKIIDFGTSKKFIRR